MKKVLVFVNVSFGAFLIIIYLGVLLQSIGSEGGIWAYFDEYSIGFTLAIFSGLLLIFSSRIIVRDTEETKKLTAELEIYKKRAEERRKDALESMTDGCMG
ncbi:MAG: hypothetical protein KJ592_03405 [Nanoarchaeota archaeon]|nr:hypothetical protein [Nanoarchaeota archaeon]